MATGGVMCQEEEETTQGLNLLFFAIKTIMLLRNVLAGNKKPSKNK
jgi:hypothetical protein